MKRLLTALLLMLPVMVLGQGVVFDSYKFNFGTIAEVDGVVEHTFRYTNKADTPFVITSVTTSCGCTSPTYSTSPLPVGSSAQFTVRFNPADRPGRFDKNIQILSNLGQINLTIHGLVTPRPRTIKDDYPFMVGGQLRASDLLIRFEPAQQGRTTTTPIAVINDSYIPLSVALDTSQLPTWLSASMADPFLNPGEKSAIILSVKPSKIWGLKSTSIPIIVNGKQQAEKINVTTIFTRDFSSTNRSMAPKAEFSTYFYHFSTQKPGARPSYTIKIRNTGLSTLHIDHVETSSPSVTYSVSQTAIPVGGTGTIKVTMNVTSTDYISEAVRVICSDPFSPIREIRLVANSF